ncbi:MAG: hypothetical protein E7477_07340 [Ruminococcaceae bacterium]|nr:hypothetical protein [Oscillospiraceae bacterium]
MKKILVAVVTVAMMISLMVPAFAEVYAGEGEIIPELIKVPMATSKPVIDGVIEEAFWGESFITANGTSRADESAFINPDDGSYLDHEAAPYANSEFFFRWDEQYIYMAVKVSKPYESAVDEYAAWGADTDGIQVYFGLDDGDGDMYNDPHCQFWVNSNAECTEAYAQVFEQSMPDAADNATASDLMLAAVAQDGLYTIYEVALPLSEALGSEGALNDEYLFSLAFFFGGGTYGYQVGQSVFWAEKTPLNSPMLVFSEALAVEEEPEATEPEVTEPEVTEPEVTEPEVTEPEVTEPEVTEEPEVTPAPSNPSTADVSVLFYALAAISAIGGISVFKRK